MLITIFLTHIIGSVLMALAYSSPGKNWMTKYGIEHNYWLSQYNYSFYYSSQLTSTIASGDIDVANNREAVFNIFMMIVGYAYLAYEVLQMVTIFGIVELIRADLQQEL